MPCLFIGMALLSSFGKQGIKLNLLSRKFDIEDTDPTSKYFCITEFNRVFTAGRNSVSFNGSSFLANKSEILVECIDSSGASLYIEHAKSTESQYTDASKFVISVSIFSEVYNGPAKLVLVGTTKKGEIVRWVGNLTIDKTLQNNSKVRFYYKPTLEVNPLLYPVIDTNKAQVEYPPPAATAEATGVAIINSRVFSVTINATGKGYNNNTATVTFSGGSPDIKATGSPILDVNGGIIGVQIINAGAGYKSIPTVTFGGSNSVAAAGTAVLKSEVVSINVTNGGSGYKFTPKVVITPIPNGSGAIATAHLTDDKVSSVTIENGGDGYTIIPKVTFEFPDPPLAPDINVPVNFSSSFICFAGNPAKDTSKSTFNPKQIDVDYRLQMTGSSFRQLSAEDFIPVTWPYKSMNSQMEGHSITLHITKIQQPLSYNIIPVHLTASFIIKKVLDAQTIQLNEPFYYTVGKTQYVTNIVEGRAFLDYQYILYNTSPDSSLYFSSSNSSPKIPVKESHAEVVYRNVKCFSGFVARHKLYRKSSYYPGDFQLISDEILSPLELLNDQVTYNKFYERMGIFYNQAHVNKYWFSTDPDLKLQASTFPINSMKIYANSFELADGIKSVMVKTDTIGGTNDSLYYPYNETEYNQLSGSSYNSNFINLKKDVLYVLSTNISIEKPVNDTSKISFYFTSSISSIKMEKTYNPSFGLKLGEIISSEKTSVKRFNSKQFIYFTPSDDYYGTLVIVPYHCNVTLSDVSLKPYGDIGFSPDTHTIRIPFKVNTAAEAFDLKSELLDINSTVVYSNLKTVQTFDSNGESLYGQSLGSGNTVVTVVQPPNPHFPDLPNCDITARFVGWHPPDNDTTSISGRLCYTNVSRLFINSDDYIELHEFQNGIEHQAKTIAVQYDYTTKKGRKIFINELGVKEEWP